MSTDGFVSCALHPRFPPPASGHDPGLFLYTYTRGVICGILIKKLQGMERNVHVGGALYSLGCKQGR